MLMYLYTIYKEYINIASIYVVCIIVILLALKKLPKWLQNICFKMEYVLNKNMLHIKLYFDSLRIFYGLI